MSEGGRSPLPLDENLRFQRQACAQAGSPLYAELLDSVLDDVAGGGVCAEILAPRAGDPFGSALPLRFLGAVHRVVLAGGAPALAAHYPSAGGDPGGGLGDAFVATVREARDEIEARIGDGVQTNEVGRCAALVGGFAEVVRSTGLPLRVLEVGASAGLNLRWDHYWYDTGAGRLGDPASAVRFTDWWDAPGPALPSAVQVAERRGCDRHPLDATSDDGRRTLLAYVWPDQLDRIARLEAAIEVARRVPVTLELADAGDWVAARVAEPADGLATVVFHSIVLQYLSTESRHRMRDALRAAGATAHRGATLHWLRMEPAGDHADVQLTSWTGAPSDGVTQVLATCGFHGRPVSWRAPEA